MFLCPTHCFRHCISFFAIIALTTWCTAYVHNAAKTFWPTNIEHFQAIPKSWNTCCTSYASAASSITKGALQEFAMASTHAYTELITVFPSFRVKHEPNWTQCVGSGPYRNNPPSRLFQVWQPQGTGPNPSNNRRDVGNVGEDHEVDIKNMGDRQNLFNDPPRNIFGTKGHLDDTSWEDLRTQVRHGFGNQSDDGA